MCNMIVDGIAYTFGVFLGEFVTYFKEGKGRVAWVGSCLSGVYLSAGTYQFNIMSVKIELCLNSIRCIHLSRSTGHSNVATLKSL